MESPLLLCGGKETGSAVGAWMDEAEGTGRQKRNGKARRETRGQGDKRGTARHERGGRETKEERQEAGDEEGSEAKGGEHGIQTCREYSLYS